MVNDTTTPMFKRCTKCGEEKPATTEYFSNRQASRDGLCPSCKQCRRDYNQQNQEKIRQYAIDYYWKNHDRVLQQQREAHRRNPEKRLARARSYLQKNPHHGTMAWHRRRARKLELPNNFTSQHWLRCIEYWHGCCAVCGNQLRDLFGDVEPNADHWIPLSYKSADNPGTVPENMICLCSDCNLSKHGHMPTSWLARHYNPKQVKAILKHIEQYFEWVKRQDELL